MNYGRLFSIVLLLLFPIGLNAQLFKGKSKFPKNAEEAAKFEKAEGLFDTRVYTEAIVLYKEMEKDNPDLPILLFRIGVCLLNTPDGIEKSLEYLSKIDMTVYDSENVEYYFARSLHLNSKYEEAIIYFEQFKKNKNADKDLKKLSETYIQNCKNGIELGKTPLQYQIKNVGAPINTINSEYAPIIVSDESQIFYTYRGTKSLGGLQEPVTNPNATLGEYYEDIYTSVKNAENQWTEPYALPAPINNDDNNASVCISGDGQQLFIFNSVPGDLGSISFTKLFGTEWTIPELVPGDVNSDSWEGHIAISSDKRYMIFASERPGGLGGIDLYSAERINDIWGNVKNLGPEINTPLDEHGPFIHPSGQFFVFSSKGHNSVGGYDLYKCMRVNDTVWEKPENMGVPLNTPLDDVFYVISGDGAHGFYSSGKAGGFGGQDIYMTQPSIIGVTIIMAQVKGFVTLNDQPVVADIKINYGDNGEKLGDYFTYASNGKYLVDLFAGEEYTITYTVEGLAPQIRKIDTRSIKKFEAFEIHVQFYKRDSTAITQLQHLEPGNNMIEVAPMADGKFTFKAAFTKETAYFKLQPADNSIKEVNVSSPELGFTKAILNDDGYYRIPLSTDLSIEDVLVKYADYTNGKLKYHVQIGAYNLPMNFNYSAATKYGKVEKQKLEDNITRFVIGTTDKLSEARALCKKIVDAGITDAFVTGEYDGKRYMLRDLALNKFFSEQ